MPRPRKNDAAALAAMADLIVSGALENVSKWSNAGVATAARIVAEQMSLFRKVHSVDAEAERLRKGYRVRRARLEEAARRRLTKRAKDLESPRVTGLGIGILGQTVWDHDRIIAETVGDLLAKLIPAALEQIDPRILQGQADCGALKARCDALANEMEQIAATFRAVGKNLSD